MQPFTRLTGVAAPLDLANIDTDKSSRRVFCAGCAAPGMQIWRSTTSVMTRDGKERADFVLNQAPYRDAKILIAGVNFGCGSSREAAVYVMYDYGIRSVIAPSFGDIHYGNELQNGMLPVVLPEATVQKLREQLQAKPGAEISIDLPLRASPVPMGPHTGLTSMPIIKSGC
jgi:3-isopropylmalate/(R)-2-methylmalate dehydratase small subunit